MTKIILVDTEKTTTQEEEKLFINYDFFYHINNMSYKVETTQELELSELYDYLKTELELELNMLSLTTTNKYLTSNSKKSEDVESRIKRAEQKGKEKREIIQNIEAQVIKTQKVRMMEKTLKIKLSVLTEKTGWVVIREKSFDKDSNYELKKPFDFNFEEKISQMKDLMVSTLYSSIPEKEEELILQRSLAFLKKFVPLREKAIMS